MRIPLIAAVAALAAAGTAGAQPTSHAGMNHAGMSSKTGAMAGPALPTPDYLTASGQSDQFEVQEGKLAQRLGKSPAVKTFGRMMVTEHTKTTDTLMKAVAASGMTPPPPPPLRADQQAMIDELSGKTGDDFDRTYVSQQLTAHQEALSVQTGYAAGGSEPKLKAVAAKTAPIVQSHINTLTAMQTNTGG